MGACVGLRCRVLTSLTCVVCVQAIAEDSLTAYSVWNRDTRAEIAARAALRVAAYEAVHPSPAVEAPEEDVVQRMHLGAFGSEETTGFDLHCLAQEPRLGRVFLRYLTDAPAATCDAAALAGDVAAGAHDLTNALVAATHASGREAVLPVLEKGVLFVRGVGQVGWEGPWGSRMLTPQPLQPGTRLS